MKTSNAGTEGMLPQINDKSDDNTEWKSSKKKKKFLEVCDVDWPGAKIFFVRNPLRSLKSDTVLQKWAKIVNVKTEGSAYELSPSRNRKITMWKLKLCKQLFS